MTMTIGELSEEKPGGGPAKPSNIDNILSGVSVQDLTPELRKRLGVTNRVKGVVVIGDDEGIGLSPGDIILEVNRQAVDDVQEYYSVVSKIGPEDDVLLLIFRDGGIFYMPFTGK